MARYPDENTWWNTVRDGVIETCASVGITFPEQYDWDTFKWWARTASGIGALCAYANKFSGKCEQRTITGGIGHNVHQDALQAFANAVIDGAKANHEEHGNE